MKGQRMSPWWKGERGEWLVVGQVVLALLIIAGPRSLPGLADWSLPFVRERQIAGAVLIFAGGALFLAGAFTLGPGLTPLPYPKENAPLIEDGPYALVRHPIYSGGMAAALGVAISLSGWLTLVYVAALFVLLDVKSRREERWLAEKFPDYPAYQRRVHKLIPFIY
jgi:protein-S-isoprenylcysteine O-methyltransferase Ste14